jgi:peroxiredoxin
MSRLFAGNAAPDFDAPDADDSQFSLRNARGRRVWLTFYRFATCPFCGLRIHEVDAFLNEKQPRDAVVLSVFSTPRDKLRDPRPQSWRAMRVLPDPDSKLYEKYGVESSLLGMLHPANFGTGIRASRAGLFRDVKRDGPATRMPAEFLIDESGTLSEAHYGSHPADHITFARVDAFLRPGDRT